MRVGDYVRNQYGIAKVIDIENNYGIDTLVLDNNICFMVDYRTGEINENIPFFNKLPLTINIDLNKVKSSPNIIDLIEVGDYVNGYIVIEATPNDKRKKQQITIAVDYREYGEDYLENKNIESVITKEQIEAMEYKI